MHFRHFSHDYRGKGIYMITIATEDRHPVLGALQPPSDLGELALKALSLPVATTSVRQKPPACIKLSTIGASVVHSWRSVLAKYPQIQNIWLTVMPDHIHALFHVRDRLPLHLGKIIASFKAISSKSAYTALESADKLDSARRFIAFENCKLKLWESGFNDRIIKNPEQLQNSIAYLKDNPRRLWLKQQHAEYFAQLEVKLAGHTFNSVGNIHLLSADRLLPVHISSRQKEESIQQQIQVLIKAARQGAVLVSPFISEGEKAVEKALAELNLPHVKLLENGFGEFFKPAGKAFDACAQGKLLLLAPWEHHNDQRRITRAQCLALNQMAANICRVCSSSSN